MIEPLDGAAPARRPWTSGPLARRCLHRLCTSNPFYALSAVLVLLGLRMSCDPGGLVFPTWALLAGLAGYTLLMAVTAAVLVRVLGVWDDVRTLLLLVVMTLTAAPAFFDDILARDPRLGISCELGGLAFALIVSEALLRAIRLRLPWRFRLPYHALIALFFLHPLALAPFLREPANPALLWLLLGFPAAAALVFLMLLPAIRRGPAYVAENGSPWRWPLYPWSLFAILGVAVVARSYSLCLSVNYSGASGRYESIYATIFGPYFLVPLAMAAAVLVLEAGLVTGSPLARIAGLWIPVAAVVMAGVGHRPDPSYGRLIGLLHEDLGGTPLFLATIAAAAFYAVAVFRRVPGSMAGVTAAMVALTVIGPGSLRLADWVAPRPIPLLALAAMQGILAIRQASSPRALATAVCLAIASPWGLQANASPALSGFVGVHVLMAGLAAIVLLFRDPFARFLRGVTAVGLGGLAIGAMLGKAPASLPPEWLNAYPLLPVAVAGMMGWYLGDAALAIVGLAVLTAWLGSWGWQGYGLARRSVVGLDQITCGVASFAVAAGISLWKARSLPGRPRTHAKPRAWPGSPLAEPLPAADPGLG